MTVVDQPAASPTTSNANETRRELRRARYRKNIMNLTAPELNDLRHAYEGLYALSRTEADDGTANPAGNPNDERGYQWVAGVHGAPPPVYCEHGSLHFPSWHRAYLYYFEKLLQDQVPAVTLPWWDWSSEVAQQAGLPEAVTVETYEDLESGETKPNPLASAYSQTTGEPTRRSPSTPAELAPLAAAVEFAMVQIEYTNFVSNLENPHNSLHVWVGGDMSSVDTAAYDPVFWMHHAQVDRLWYMWQQEHPSASIPPEALSFVCEPFNMTGAEVLDATALGYSYADDETLVSAVDVRAAAEALGVISSDEAEAGEAEAAAPEPRVTFPLDPVPRVFRRATLEFVGIEPTVDSYTAHIFLNNPEADLATQRTMESGYAGTLALFGHGECLGGPGHCDVPDRSADPFDLRPEHHLAPFDTYVDITFPLLDLAGRAAHDGAVPLTVSFVVADVNNGLADPSVLDFEAVAVVTRA